MVVFCMNLVCLRNYIPSRCTDSYEVQTNAGLPCFNQLKRHNFLQIRGLLSMYALVANLADFLHFTRFSDSELLMGFAFFVMQCVA